MSKKYVVKDELSIVRHNKNQNHQTIKQNWTTGSLISTGSGSQNILDMDSVQQLNNEQNNLTIKNLSKQITKSLISLFCIMSETTSVPHAFVWISWLIEEFQLAAIILNTSEFPWSDFYVTNFQNFMGYFILQQLDQNISIYFIVACSIVGLITIFVGVVSFLLTTNEIQRDHWSIGLCKTFIMLISTICFIPILHVILNTMTCPRNDTSGLCSEYDGGHIIQIAIGSTMTIITVLIAFMANIALYEDNSSSHAPLASSHCRLNLANLAVRLIFVLTDAVIEDKVNQWVSCLFLCTPLFLLTFLYIWYPSYYSWHYVQGRCFQFGGLAFAGLCLIVTNIINDSQKDGPSLMLYVSGGFVSALSVFICRFRRSITIEKVSSISQLNDQYEVELKIRYLLESFDRERRKPEALKEEELSDMHQGHTEISKKADEQLLFQQVETHFLKGFRLFPDSSLLHVWFSNFCMTYKNNRYSALRHLVKAEELNPSFDVQFMIYRQRQRLEQFFASRNSNKDILIYMDFQKHMIEALKYDELTTKTQLIFWDTLLQEHTDMVKLHQISNVISTYLKSALNHYQQLIKLNNKSPQVFRMYASFLLDIANDPQKAAQLLSKAKELEDEQTKRNNEKNDFRVNEKLTLFDERNAILILSGSDKTLGQICESNAGASRLFGYQQSELINTYSSDLLPEPYSSEHRLFLVSFQEMAEPDGDSINNNNNNSNLNGEDISISMMSEKMGTIEQFIMVKSRSGFIAPTRCELRKFTTNGCKSMSILALFQSIQTDNHYLLVEQTTGIVTGCTSGCSALFRFTISDVKAKNVNINTFIYNYEDRREEFMSENGTKIYWSDKRGAIKEPIESISSLINDELLYEIQIWVSRIQDQSLFSGVKTFIHQQIDTICVSAKLMNETNIKKLKSTTNLRRSISSKRRIQIDQTVDLLDRQVQFNNESHDLLNENENNFESAFDDEDGEISILQTDDLNRESSIISNLSATEGVLRQRQQIRIPLNAAEFNKAEINSENSSKEIKVDEIQSNNSNFDEIQIQNHSMSEAKTFADNLLESPEPHNVNQLSQISEASLEPVSPLSPNSTKFTFRSSSADETQIQLKELEPAEHQEQKNDETFNEITKSETDQMIDGIPILSTANDHLTDGNGLANHDEIESIKGFDDTDCPQIEIDCVVSPESTNDIIHSPRSQSYSQQPTKLKKTNSPKSTNSKIGDNNNKRNEKSAIKETRIDIIERPSDDDGQQQTVEYYENQKDEMNEVLIQPKKETSDSSTGFNVPGTTLTNSIPSMNSDRRRVVDLTSFSSHLHSSSTGISLNYQLANSSLQNQQNKNFQQGNIRRSLSKIAPVASESHLQHKRHYSQQQVDSNNSISNFVEKSHSRKKSSIGNSPLQQGKYLSLSELTSTSPEQPDLNSHENQKLTSSRRNNNVDWKGTETGDEIEETRSQGTMNSKFSSSSSTASSQKISRKIRQAVLSENQGISKGLRKFKYVFILSIFLVCAVSIGIFIATNTLISAFNSNVELIRQASLRRYYAVQLAQDAMRLRQIAIGIKNDDPSIYQIRISDTADNLFAADAALYAKLSSLDQEHYNLYTTPQLTVYELDEHGQRVANKASLWTGSNAVQLHARMLIRKPITTWDSKDPDYYYVVNNSPFSLFQGYDQSTQLYERMSANQVASMGTWSLALMCSAIVMMLLVIVTVVRPTVYDVEDSKSQVMLIFLDIPPNTIMKTKSLCEKRAAQFRQEAEGDEIEQNLDNTEEASLIRNERHEQQHATQKKRVRGSKTKKATGQSDKQKWIFLTKISLIFVVSMAYFITVYVAGFIKQQFYLQTAPSEQNYAAISRMSIKRANLLLSYYAYQNELMLPSSIWQSYDSVHDYINYGIQVNEWLTYGNLDLKITGIANAEIYGRSDNQNDIYFNDGCHYPNPDSQCDTFANGIMSTGLYSAKNFYFNILKQILANTNSTIESNKTTAFSNSSMSAFVNAPIKTIVNTLDNNYLANSCTYHNILLSTTLTDTLNTQVIQFGLIMLLCFNSIAIGLYIFLYQPLIKVLDTQIKRTRSMLLMIPIDVLDSIPAVKAFLAESTTML